MSRISACKDPSIWHHVVIAWLNKKVQKLAARRARSKEKAAADRAARGEKPAPPDPPRGTRPGLSGRFRWELDSRIERANSGENDARWHASAIVAHFYWAIKEGKAVDPRVVEYIDKARDRYCRDPRRNIAKALGLLKSNRGNPGRVPSKKRRLTPDGFIEAGQMVLMQQQRDEGSAENLAVDTVANLLNVSPRTVRKAAAAAKRTRRSRDEAVKGHYRRKNREFPQ